MNYTIQKIVQNWTSRDYEAVQFKYLTKSGPEFFHTSTIRPQSLCLPIVPSAKNVSFVLQFLLYFLCPHLWLLPSHFHRISLSHGGLISQTTPCCTYQKWFIQRQMLPTKGYQKHQNFSSNEDLCPSCRAIFDPADSGLAFSSISLKVRGRGHVLGTKKGELTVFSIFCHKTLTIFCDIFPNAAQNMQQSTKKEGVSRP